jgi:hypothetical protein
VAAVVLEKLTVQAQAEQAVQVAVVLVLVRV